MKEYLVQEVVDGEMAAYTMTKEKLVEHLQLDNVADFIESIAIFDVSKFGVVKKVKRSEIWEPTGTIASLSDSDAYRDD